MTTLNFTYQQPEKLWMKSGCADNLWVKVDTYNRTIQKFYSCFMAQENDIKVSKKDCEKIFQHFVDEGFIIQE